MKKIVGLLATLMILSTALFGCSTKTATSQNTQGTQNQQGNNQGSGQKQMQRADLSGEVTAVNGNQVTIKVIKQPDRTGNQPGAQGNGQSNNQSSGQNNGQTNNQSSSQGTNNQGNNGQGPNRQRQMEFTGETKTITIPDGTQIATFVRGDQGRQSKQLQVKDIQANSIIQVWYSDKQNETVSRINVTAPRTQQGQSQTTN